MTEIIVCIRCSGLVHYLFVCVCMCILEWICFRHLCGPFAPFIHIPGICIWFCNKFHIADRLLVSAFLFHFFFHFTFICLYASSSVVVVIVVVVVVVGRKLMRILCHNTENEPHLVHANAQTLAACQKHFAFNDYSGFNLDIHCTSLIYHLAHINKEREKNNNNNKHTHTLYYSVCIVWYGKKKEHFCYTFAYWFLFGCR